MSKKTPHETDIHIGSKVRQFRILRGMSQERLAETLGLTFQQVQKYEKGANRIGGSRLFHIAQILEVPVASLFPDQDGDLTPAPVISGEEAGLLRGYRELSTKQQGWLRGLVRSIAWPLKAAA